MTNREIQIAKQIAVANAQKKVEVRIKKMSPDQYQKFCKGICPTSEGEGRIYANEKARSAEIEADEIEGKDVGK